MNSSNNAGNYNLSQLMVTAAAREICDGEVVFVGMRLPLLGFLLAKSTHAPGARPWGIYPIFAGRNGWPILPMPWDCSSREPWISALSAAPRWIATAT